MSRGLETFVLRRCAAVTTSCEGVRGELRGRGLPAGKKVLGFIGSFYAYEGLDLLIGALPAILTQRDDVVLLLVGGGSAEPALRRLIDTLGLAERVRFVGRVPHGEVQRYYDLVDVFVYPRHSMRLTELVTPLKPLEAMARGRMVLASDVGGHRELVRDKATGSLFKADDEHDLARAVIDILAHEDDWPRIRMAARQFVETERTWRHSVAHYRHAYGNALMEAGRAY